MRSPINSCSIFILIIVFYLYCSSASYASNPKKYGIFLHNGAGSGHGIGLSVYLDSEKHQIRSSGGYIKTTHNAYIDHWFIDDPVRVHIDGLAATIAYRGYMLPWMYSSIGLIHFRQRASYTAERIYKGKGEGTVFSIPVLVGLEYGSSNLVSIYLEAGCIFNLNNIKGVNELKLEGNISKFTIYRDPVSPVLGFGVSVNFGDS